MRLTLTKQAEYALRALVWLAQVEDAERRHPDEPAHRHKAAAISDAAGIPPLFAARVLAHLQREGLLRARAGQHGGYTLARPAVDISFLDVVEAVEGPLQTSTCVLRDTACSDPGRCVLHDAWSAAQQALRTSLGHTSLATTIRSSGQRVGFVAGAAGDAPLPRVSPAAPTTRLLTSPTAPLAGALTPLA